MSEGWRDGGNGPHFSFSFQEEVLELFTSMEIRVENRHFFLVSSTYSTPTLPTVWSDRYIYLHFINKMKSSEVK